MIEKEKFLQKGSCVSDVKKHLLVLGSHLHKMTSAEVLLFVILSAMGDRQKKALSVLLRDDLAGRVSLC